MKMEFNDYKQSKHMKKSHRIISDICEPEKVEEPEKVAEPSKGVI
jgi:hypothetical protein